MDLEKLSFKNIFFYCILITALISSGVLFIFVFNYNLFFLLDIWKLLLLSISITSPIFILNSLFILFGAIPSEDEEEFLLTLMLLAGALTTLTLYLVITAAFFLKFKIKIAVIILATIELILLIILFVNHLINKGKKPTK